MLKCIYISMKYLIIQLGSFYVIKTLHKKNRTGARDDYCAFSK